MTKRNLPYLFLNLSQDGQLSAYNWSEEDGITPVVASAASYACSFDSDCGIDEIQKQQQPSKTTYRNMIPPSNLSKCMATVHHHHQNDSSTANTNCMDLMFHQWKTIHWYKVGSTPSLTTATIDTTNEIDEIEAGGDLDQKSKRNSNVSEADSSYYEKRNSNNFSRASNHSCTSTASESSNSSFSDSTTSFTLTESRVLDSDRTTELATEYGPALFSKMMHNMKMGNDTKTFQDFGMPFTFPLACSMAYAVQGQAHVIEEILQSLDQFCFSYEEHARNILSKNRCQYQDENDIDQAIKSIFQHGIGWCGWYLYLAYYRMRAFTNVLPIAGSRSREIVSDEDEESIIDSIGISGLKLMHWGLVKSKESNYGQSSSPSSVMKALIPHVREIIQEEIDLLIAMYRINRMSLGQRINKEERRNQSFYNPWDPENDSKNKDTSGNRELESSSYEQRKKQRKKQRKQRIIKQLLGEEIQFFSSPSLHSSFRYNDTATTGTTTKSTHHHYKRQHQYASSSSSIRWGSIALSSSTSSLDYSQHRPHQNQRRRRRRRRRRTLAADPKNSSNRGSNSCSTFGRYKSLH